MNQFVQLGLISSLVLSHSAIALNPVQGFYGGLIAGASSGPSGYERVFTNNGLIYAGRVNNNRIGGGGGGSIGYRIQNFRIEGEAFYNYLRAGTLSLTNCTLESPNVFTPTPVTTCPRQLTVEGLGFNGSTSALFGMVNGFYDFITYDSESTLVPYIGVGLGGARLKNSVNFIRTYTKFSSGDSVTTSSSAVQGILGISYYLDDFTWAGMDYRYLTTTNLNKTGNTSRYGLNTLNFTINFAFDNS